MPEIAEVSAGASPRCLSAIFNFKHLDRFRQRDMAARLGANPGTITNWELGHTEPELRFLPAIIRFLNYAPWTTAACTGEHLLTYRRERGLSQAALARLLGVDPGTLSRWERNLRVPTGRYARLTVGFLGP